MPLGGGNEDNDGVSICCDVRRSLRSSVGMTRGRMVDEAALMFGRVIISRDEVRSV
jgi:hypothetical protein